MPEKRNKGNFRIFRATKYSIKTALSLRAANVRSFASGLFVLALAGALVFWGVPDDGMCVFCCYFILRSSYAIYMGNDGNKNKGHLFHIVLARPISYYEVLDVIPEEHVHNNSNQNQIWYQVYVVFNSTRVFAENLFGLGFL